MPSNMVLRFRDLVADTIPEHRKLIEKYGYVWWGWWSKTEEKTPFKEFSTFDNIIKENGSLWVFLADSGTQHLYKAKLIEIDFNDDDDPKECSEIDKVPEYYFAREYKVWFRFESIIDAFPEDIKEWAYDKKCSFSQNETEKPYHNKQISNLGEMFNHCHRTIYFINQYTDINIDQKHIFEKEIAKYVQLILETIEEINKICDLSSTSSPIFIPTYPKEMENGLKTPATNDLLLSNFSSFLYKLFIDGHKKVNDGKAIISKFEFYKIADSLLNAIRMFRHNFHHSDDKLYFKNKKKLGEIYSDLAGKYVLDDSYSKIKFQKELLKWTLAVLKNEHKLVQKTISLKNN